MRGAWNGMSGRRWVAFGRGTIALGVLAASMLVAAPAWSVSAASNVDVDGDFAYDLVIGAPGEGHQAPPGSGAVYELRGPAPFIADFTADRKPGAASGSAMAVGDFDADGYDDVAVGAPGANRGAGAVTVFFGGGAGMHSHAAVNLVQPGAASEPGDAFGFALAAGDFDADQSDDLVVGAPGENAGAGAVSVFHTQGAGSARFRPARVFTQLGSRPERGDRFGAALATGDFDRDSQDELVAGAPGEDAGTVRDAGAITILASGEETGVVAAGARLLLQRAGRPETGDRFGSALATGDFDENQLTDLAVGVPGEAVGAVAGAGAVSVLGGSRSGGLPSGPERAIVQGGRADERGDAFGAALTVGDFDDDWHSDLVVGAPLEDVGRVRDAGAVTVLPGADNGPDLARTRVLSQDSPGVPGAAEAGDLFGAALAVGGYHKGSRYHDLAVGAPLEDAGRARDAGAVMILAGTGAGVSTGGALVITQPAVSGVVGAEPGDLFGAALATERQSAR